MTNNHGAKTGRAFTSWWRESNNIRNKIKRFASSFGRLAMQYVDFFISFLIINILSLHFPCTWSEINTNSPYVIFFFFLHYFWSSLLSPSFCWKSVFDAYHQKNDKHWGKDVIILKPKSYSKRPTTPKRMS